MSLRMQKANYELGQEYNKRGKQIQEQQQEFKNNYESHQVIVSIMTIMSPKTGHQMIQMG